MTTPADDDLPYWHQRRALEQPFRHALRYGVSKVVAHRMHGSSIPACYLVDVAPTL